MNELLLFRVPGSEFRVPNSAFRSSDVKEPSARTKGAPPVLSPRERVCARKCVTMAAGKAGKCLRPGRIENLRKIPRPSIRALRLRAQNRNHGMPWSSPEAIRCRTAPPGAYSNSAVPIRRMVAPSSTATA